MGLGIGLGLGVRAAGGAGYVPVDEGNCVLWLDASRGVTIATGVSQWNDQSGKGNSVAQATGSKQPTFNAVDAAANGHPTLSYLQASQQQLTKVGFALPQPSTWYVVGQETSGLGASFIDSTDATHTTTVYSAAGSKLGMYSGSVVSGTLSVATMCVMCCVFNGASSDGYVNNSGTANPSNVNPGSENQAGLSVGGGFAGSYMTGKIAEVLAFSGVHSPANIKRVFAYLGRKYGIAVS